MGVGTGSGSLLEGLGLGVPQPLGRLGRGAFPAQGLGTETSLQGWVLCGLVHRAGGAKLHLELLLHLGSGGTRPGSVQWGRQELAAPASHGSGKTHQAQEMHWSLQAVKLVQLSRESQESGEQSTCPPCSPSQAAARRAQAAMCLDTSCPHIHTLEPRSPPHSQGWRTPMETAPGTGAWAGLCCTCIHTDWAEPLRIKTPFNVTINYIFTIKSLQIHPKVNIKIDTLELCQSAHLCTNTYTEEVALKALENGFWKVSWT